MKIYTSYFAKIKNLPKDMIPIAICGKAPDWYRGLQYKKLAPKIGFFIEWELNHDNQFYIDHFYDEVLSTLDFNQVVDDLSHLSGGNDVVLICYEKPGTFCHRHLVADWLTSNGIECNEITV